MRTDKEKKNSLITDFLIVPSAVAHMYWGKLLYRHATVCANDPLHTDTARSSESCRFERSAITKHIRRNF